MKNFKAVRGMNDLFEPEISLWRKIENTMAKIFSDHCYEEVRTPILEDLGLFKRGVGETTDVVEKEMFIINDAEHQYCLRAENTAPLVRALIEKGGMGEEFNKKFFYMGPMFRKERPQKGRLRQFHQFGLECFGVDDPLAEIEIITLTKKLFDILKLNFTLKINSLGTAHERIKYKEGLKKFLLNFEEKLCEDCKRRLKFNTLRMLDCKKEECIKITQNAPKSLDYLENDSLNHFLEVKNGLKDQGIDFEVDNRLVRGLDYYDRTVFEFVADFGLGSQNAIAAGGRYDGLFKTLGNSLDIKAVGIAGGIERIILLMAKEEISLLGPKLTLISADEQGFLFIPKLAFSLRDLGIKTDFCLSKKSLKAQMRRADKLNAENIAVIGKNELDKKEIIIKGFNDNKNIKVFLDVKNIKDAL